MQPPVDTKEAEALPVKPAPVTKAVTPSVLAAGTKAVDLEVPPANGNVQKTAPLTQPSVKEPAENPSTPASVSESSTSGSSEAIEPKPDEDPAKSKLNAAALWHSWLRRFTCEVFFITVTSYAELLPEH